MALAEQLTTFYIPIDITPSGWSLGVGEDKHLPLDAAAIALTGLVGEVRRDSATSAALFALEFDANGVVVSKESSLMLEGLAKAYLVIDIVVADKTHRLMHFEIEVDPRGAGAVFEPTRVELSELLQAINDFQTLITMTDSAIDNAGPFGNVNQSDTFGGQVLAKSNVDNLYCQALHYDMTVNLNCFGDSLTAMNSAGSGGDKWTNYVSNFMSGIQSNYGVGGQESDEVLARIVAQDAGELAKAHTLMMGTNNIADPTQILADYATAYSTVTGNMLVIGPISSGTIAGTGGMIHRISTALKAAYGDNFIDITHSMRRAAYQDGDRLNVRRGGHPESLMYDATHPSKVRGGAVMAAEIAAAVRAMEGGAPFIHDDLVTWSSAASAGDIVGSTRYLGACQDFKLTNQSYSDFFRIDSATGAVKALQRQIVVSAPYI